MGSSVFPSKLDSFTDPSSSSPMNGAPSHSQQHGLENDAIAALEAKVGVNGSTDSSSLDYQLGQRYHDRGAWTANTSYQVNDVVVAPDGTVQLCTTGHTSGASYDPSYWSQRGVQSGAYASVLSAIGNASTGGDAAALTSAIAGSGNFKGKPGSTFYLEGPVVIPSNTILDMTGCTVQTVNGLNNHLIHNYGYAHPVATASDGAITSGTNTLTTSLGASAVVGQTVTVAGATSGGYQALCGQVSAKTSTTITITDLYGNTLNAGATVSGAAVTLYNRDSNIILRGGTWNKNGSGGQGTGIGVHGIFFRHVDGLVIDMASSASNCGKYAVCLASVSNFTVRNHTLKATYSDGVHIDGPAIIGTVENIFGSAGDDFAVITAEDWHQFGDVCGDVADVTFNNIMPNGTTRAVLKLMAGPGGAVRRIAASNIRGSSTTTDTAVWVGDDITQPETTGGYIDGIALRNITPFVPNGSQVWLCSNLGRVEIDGLLINNSSQTKPAVACGPIGTTPMSIDSLELSHVYLKAFGGNQNVVNINGYCTINSLKVKDWRSTATQTHVPVAVNGGTVNDLTVEGAHGSFISPNAGFVHLPSAAAVVNRLRFHDIDLTGSGGSATGLVTATAAATLPDVQVSEATLSQYAWLFALNTKTNVKLQGVTTGTGMAGLGYVYASGVVTVSGAGNNLAIGSYPQNNWAGAAGGIISVRLIDGPASANALAIPSGTVGAGAGTGATMTVYGSDHAGTATVATGTGTAAGAVCTVTLVASRLAGNTPRIVIAPSDSGGVAAATQLYVSAKTANSFTVSAKVAPTASATLAFDYIVDGV